MLHLKIVKCNCQCVPTTQTSDMNETSKSEEKTTTAEALHTHKPHPSPQMCRSQHPNIHYKDPRNAKTKVLLRTNAWRTATGPKEHHAGHIHRRRKQHTHEVARCNAKIYKKATRVKQQPCVAKRCRSTQATSQTKPNVTRNMFSMDKEIQKYMVTQMTPKIPTI